MTDKNSHLGRGSWNSQTQDRYCTNRVSYLQIGWFGSKLVKTAHKPSKEIQVLATWIQQALSNNHRIPTKTHQKQWISHFK